MESDSGGEGAKGKAKALADAAKPNGKGKKRERVSSPEQERVKTDQFHPACGWGTKTQPEEAESVSYQRYEHRLDTGHHDLILTWTSFDIAVVPQHAMSNPTSAGSGAASAPAPQVKGVSLKLTYRAAGILTVSIDWSPQATSFPASAPNRRANSTSYIIRFI